MADAEALAMVAAATFPLACPPTTTEDAKADFIARHLSLARFGEYLTDETRLLLVLSAGTRIVGYAMLVFAEPYDAGVRAVIRSRPVAELSKFYVMPDLHGAGAAARLMDASIAAATTREAHSIWLGVNQHNQRANRFYEKSGFVRVGVKRFLVGDVWEDDFVRERVLTA